MPSHLVRLACFWLWLPLSKYEQIIPLVLFITPSPTIFGCHTSYMVQPVLDLPQFQLCGFIIMEKPWWGLHTDTSHWTPLLLGPRGPTAQPILTRLDIQGLSFSRRTHLISCLFHEAFLWWSRNIKPSVIQRVKHCAFHTAAHYFLLNISQVSFGWVNCNSFRESVSHFHFELNVGGGSCFDGWILHSF